MNSKQKTTWVTIPEKQVSVPKKPRKQLSSFDKVQNKGWWALGLFALLIFSVLVFMPEQTSRMRANLFDGDFQFIPDPAEQEGGALFGGGGEGNEEGVSDVEAENAGESDESQTSTNQNSSTSSDAVPIQIDPLESLPQEVPEQVPVEQPSVEEVPSEASQQVNSELQALLESLSAQLEELKKDGLKKDQEIQALNELLQQQQAQHQAATSAAQQQSQQSTSTSQGQVNPNGGTYRFNTHTVTVNPFDVLVQNKQSLDQLQQPSLQANVSQAQPSSAVTLATVDSTVLNSVQSQPTTGPLDALLVAFVLTSIAILGFGIFRARRA